jgi:hypothetical protein
MHDGSMKGSTIRCFDQCVRSRGLITGPINDSDALIDPEIADRAPVATNAHACNPAAIAQMRHRGRIASNCVVVTASASHDDDDDDETTCSCLQRCAHGVMLNTRTRRGDPFT